MTKPHQESPPARRERVARIYFDYALTGIIETDAQWQIQIANQAASSITGHDAKLLRGRDLISLLSAESRGAAERHLALLQEQGTNQSEWRLVRADGAEIIVEIASVQADDDLFIHVLDDVTEKRRATAEIERARREAEAANRVKSEFLANISHEIRTPMNGIIGLSQLALMTELQPQQRDYLDKILQSGRTLLQIINDILDYSKMEAGRLQFEQHDFDLDELLDELANIASQAASGKEIELVFHIGADVPRLLVGDRLRLNQMLLNLLSNAIKFTERGQVCLAIASVEDGGAPPRLRFSVSDSGIGIDEETLSRLFRPFSQADSATTRRFGGTGLGLVITRQLAEGMGGTLAVESSPGAGSRFTLELPLACRAAPPAVAATPGTAQVAGFHPATCAAAEELLSALGWQLGGKAALCIHDLQPNAELTSLSIHIPTLLLTGANEVVRVREALGQRPDVEVLPRPLTLTGLRRALGRLGQGDAVPVSANLAPIPQEFAGARILVAEDNPVNRQVIMGLLNQAGIAVTLAEDGLQAVAALTEGPMPDLLLMDVQMPGMDGYEATRRLRAVGVTLPIIALTAGVSRAEQQACLDAGMSGFLGKPIDMDELWGTLTRWITPRATPPLAPPPSAPPRPALDAPIPGIDWESALDRFLGNRQALQRAFDAFLQHHATDSQRLYAALEADDRGEIQRITHGLKGSAGTIGAIAVARMAQRLNEQAPTATPEVLRESIRQLEIDFGKLRPGEY